MRSAGLQSMREFAIRTDRSKGKMIERRSEQQLFSRLLDFRSQQARTHTIFLQPYVRGGPQMARELHGTTLA
jgi:hypothetical protein